MGDDSRECSNISSDYNRALHVSWAARLGTREFPSTIPDTIQRSRLPSIPSSRHRQFLVPNLSTAIQNRNQLMLLTDIRKVQMPIARGGRSTHEI